MPISKQEQIQQRRTRVWELYCQGMTQEAICEQLELFHVSRRMIAYDLEWLKKHYVKDFMKDNRKRIAEEYAKVMSNLEQLRANAWKQFNAIVDDKNSSIKVALYDTLLKTNNNILTLLSVGDFIEMELKITDANGNVKEIKQEMSKVNNELRNRSQAKF